MPLVLTFLQKHLASKSADISKIEHNSKSAVQGTKEATSKAKKSKKGETKTK
jgi:hypothetical protein